MEPRSDNPPLIVIVGETASGKTQLALEMAARFNGEIIAGDSRTLYKGMDIGTAKPTTAERQLVRHHLLDISTPDKAITAKEFRQLADAAIADIMGRGKVPFLVGGTGLYIDAVLFGFSFAGEPDLQWRQKAADMEIAELQSALLERGIPLPSNKQNPRHLIRQLETGGQPGNNHQLRDNTLIIGLQVERDILRDRVARRVDAMLKHGLAAEATELLKRYGSGSLVGQTIGYKEFIPYTAKEASLDAAREALIHDTLQYAKRQRTWFRRNKAIHYICKKEDAVDLITTMLNKGTTV